MEPFIADLINNPKAPKWLRYVIVTLVCGFVIFLGVMLALKSPMLVGKFSAALYPYCFLQRRYICLQKLHKHNRSNNEIESQQFQKARAA